MNKGIYGIIGILFIWLCLNTSIIASNSKITEQKILQMKQNALKDIKNASVKISVEAVENLIKKSKLSESRFKN